MSEDDELEKLAEFLATPVFRAVFARDPWRATREAGLDPDAIDPTVFGVLTGLSSAELRALAEVGQALRDAGIDSGVVMKMV